MDGEDVLGSIIMVLCYWDIAAYNRENSIMLLVYSVPYWICGGVSFLLPGIFLLIRHYRKIEKKYINPKTLDKIDPIC